MAAANNFPFEFNQVVGFKLLITAGAQAALDRTGESYLHFLARFINRDWGVLDAHDQKQNLECVEMGFGRIMGSYELKNGDKLWIITESDRSATTILLPEEY